MANWTDVMTGVLVAKCKERGQNTYDENFVKGVIAEMVEIDRPKPKKARIGFLYITENYTPLAMTKYLSHVKKVWDDVKPPEVPASTVSANEQWAIVVVRLNAPLTDPAQVKLEFHSYLYGESLFGARITEAVKVGDKWDLKVGHNCTLEEAVVLLKKHRFVTDIYTKVISQFGVLAPPPPPPV